MRFLMVHRTDERAEQAPDPEFFGRLDAMISDWAARGVLITAEGVHPSERGASVRKARGAAITAVDGPFTEAKEVIGGFALINAADLAEAVAYAKQYADLFEDIEVEVREIWDDVPA